MAMAVSMASALGATDVCAPSAGNAGSALAAYAARGGLAAHVFVPKDIAAPVRDGDDRVRRRGGEGGRPHRRDAGKRCAEERAPLGWYECATLKEPYRVEGKKTMGYELAEQMGWTLPDAILYPTGGGTGLIGMWKAFAELEAMGFIGPSRPRMYAVQAEGCAPMVKAFQEGKDSAEPWPDAQTLAHGLRVPEAPSATSSSCARCATARAVRSPSPKPRSSRA